MAGVLLYKSHLTRRERKMFSSSVGHRRIV
jgi:hypothetical protein